MYTARVVNGVVKQVIVGDAQWASENLGGEWVDSEIKVGAGWIIIEGVLQPIPPMPDDGIMYFWDEANLVWQPVPVQELGGE